MKAKDWFMFGVLGLIWGSSFFWIKIALRGTGPFTLVAFRLLFGVLGLAVVAAIRKPIFPRLRSLWLKLAFLGAVNSAIPIVLISAGEQVIDSAVTSVLNGTVPLFTILMAHVVLDDDKITPASLAGLITGFIGIVVLLSRDLNLASFSGGFAGQAAVLLAAFFYAGSAVYARRNLRNIPPLLLALIPLFFADLLVWAAVPIAEFPFRFPSGGLTWIAILWLGLLGTFVAYLLYFSLLESVGATRTSLVTYILPVVGVALGVIFLDELLDFRLVVGAVLILMGIIFVNLKLQRSPRTANK